jgi:molybdopterin-binding protein
MVGRMPVYRLAESAAVLGVSDDTVRRWVDQGVVATTRTDSGALGIEGRDLAALATRRAGGTSGTDAQASDRARTSARNRLAGIVTEVVRDTVMAQVEMICGQHRIVSLMSREAADSLGLEPGVLADAVVKATTVVVETPSRRS